MHNFLYQKQNPRSNVETFQFFISNVDKYSLTIATGSSSSNFNNCVTATERNVILLSGHSDFQPGKFRLIWVVCEVTHVSVQMSF